MDKGPAFLSEQEHLTRASGVVGLYTLISRILGLTRDMVIAFFFGSGMLADAFVVAFRIPNLLRRLFAEGSLTVAFIPVFSEYLQLKNKHDAFAMVRTLLTVLSLILALVTLLGILLAPWMVQILAFGWHGLAEKYRLTVLLTRIMFPYVLLISLVAVFMGILNSLRRFAAPAAAPIFLNLAIIFSTLGLAPYLKQPIIGTAVGVLIGGILQVALQIPWLLKEGFSFKPDWRLHHPALKRIGRLLLPAIYGSAIYQINQMVNTLIATRLQEGSVAWLYYADRLLEFPLGIFAIAVSTAALPSLARQAAGKETADLQETLGHSLRLVFFIILPAMTGMIILREPIFQVLFQRGAFDAFATKMSGQAFFCYALGLWALAGNKVMINGFYAAQNIRTPANIATGALLLNLVFALVLTEYLQHRGLALALSLSSIFQFAALAYGLKKRTGMLVLKPVVLSVAKSLVASFFMGVSLFLLLFLIRQNNPVLSFTRQVLYLTALIFTGVVVYFITAKFLKCREMDTLGSILFKKR